MRIQNVDKLTSHGDVEGRKVVASIMEAALQAADPYHNTSKLFSLDGDILSVGNALFEADGDPNKGAERIDLSTIRRIYVVGAGKGVQRVAKAIEDVLEGRIYVGQVIAKHGDEVILKHIGVSHGAHPVPDIHCVSASQKIVDLAQDVTEDDLVFTIIGNGGSSLMTLPVQGVSLDDIMEITHRMQIEKGAPTHDLNTVRNHLDQLKGGKISRLFSKARQIHLVITDANHPVYFAPRGNYESLLQKNIWLHNLPESSMFAQAIDILKRYDLWEECPEGVTTFLSTATPQMETVKYEEFCTYRFRVFGVMPDSEHFLKAAQKKAEQFGCKAVVLSQMLMVEAKYLAQVITSIAKNIVEYGEPFQGPVVLLSSGEMLVTVGDSKEVGGRNQEFALTCAQLLAGQTNIVVGSADTDGTDGPGGFFCEDAPVCLGGGIVDGRTATEAAQRGVDIGDALKSHATSRALWELDCGMEIEHNISLQDLTVVYIR